ncbi:transposase [Nonomuraea diastatica]|uniref:Transposase n=1 Tax=Nonomuraea diastatica TaxID=1848329 RepID=A0A4R4WCY9_9ACTN|nr:transposase [Nonomuraea diastatica]
MRGLPVRPRSRSPIRAPRYATDMSDEEWQVIKPLMPWPAWFIGNGGRPGKYCRRLIMDAIRYVVDNGCKWRNLPADFLVPWRIVRAISLAGGRTVISMPSTMTCVNRFG